MPENRSKRTIVEDIILTSDRRGISFLRSYLPPNYCSQAALSILNTPGIVLIVTGFYIPSANCSETDGPPGAVVIAKALEILGYKVFFITDRFSLSLVENVSESKNIIEFPLTTRSKSQLFARDLIDEYNPSIIISIERCGANSDGTYLDMHGKNISNYNAQIDWLFNGHPNTIGIGDGGNEIGMGNYADAIILSNKLIKKPSLTKTTHTIISSVSNWGAYGLVCEISKIANQKLLISPNDEAKLIQRAVKFGAVDGISKKREPSVDGFDLVENGEILSMLHQYLEQN